jgi:hypothetical protein
MGVNSLGIVQVTSSRKIIEAKNPNTVQTPPPFLKLLKENYLKCVQKGYSVFE